MALNFPTDTSAPYVDSTSGLKYIYNVAVGAWEPAIQPPVIIETPNPPDIQIEGFLWYDGAILYIFQNGTWNTINSGGGGGGSSEVTIGGSSPEFASTGDLWWDSDEGRLYIYYVDIDSSQWVDASPASGGSNGSNVFSGPNAPSNAVEGALWYNTNNGQLYVFTSNTWNATQTAVSGIATLSVSAPITSTGTSDNPTIGISQATTSASGSVRFANQSETNSATLNNVALTPSGLSNGISNYLPQSTELARGVIELATTAEVIAGVDNTRAITPETLTAALSGLGLTIPAGTISAYAGSSAPSGYLECNGSQQSRTTYADLFGVISTTYGTGDNSTTFNLPDLRGEFIRGLDSSRGVDIGRTLGSFQADAFESHTHTGVSGNPGTDPARKGGANRVDDTDVYTTNAVGDGETRPRNVALMFIIKT